MDPCSNMLWDVGSSATGHRTILTRLGTKAEPREEFIVRTGSGRQSADKEGEIVMVFMVIRIHSMASVVSTNGYKTGNDSEWGIRPSGWLIRQVLIQFRANRSSGDPFRESIRFLKHIEGPQKVSRFISSDKTSKKLVWRTKLCNDTSVDHSWNFSIVWFFSFYTHTHTHTHTHTTFPKQLLSSTGKIHVYVYFFFGYNTYFYVFCLKKIAFAFETLCVCV